MEFVVPALDRQAFATWQCDRANEIVVPVPARWKQAVVMVGFADNGMTKLGFVEQAPEFDWQRRDLRRIGRWATDAQLRSLATAQSFEALSGIS
jgi:hypothetical protein